MDFGFPEMKVSEEGDEVVVRVWISGVDEEDIELEVKEDSLRVEIEKDFSKSVKKKGYSAREWKSSSFSGIVSLPCKVVPMLVHHSYDGKVLDVRLKKSE
ncbi:Hsp20/alpha crystallin family protein [Candidatus Pacearchaeota archaeon]|nr:Hsp20/alpha crystallin family protein [Candidatus Pacearchaeota archaeon]